MRSSGFTLVELLSVVVLLGALAIIVTVSTSSTLKTSKTKLTEIQIANIEKAAQMYHLKEGINESDYRYDETKTCVNVGYLIENDYIEDEELKNIKTNKQMLGSVKIVYKYDTYTYKYQDSVCKSSDYDQYLNTICTPVTEETKTVGNIPTGDYIPGDEYICEIKSGVKYNFFVLSKNGDNINLILDRNINSDGTLATKGITKDNAVNGVYSYTSWISDYDYKCGNIGGCYATNDKGPITAMNYLYNATKNWDSIPNIVINHNDEYGNIKTIGAITSIIKTDNITITVSYNNLKARLPNFSELKEVGCDIDSSFTNVQTCPVWLVNYLYEYEDVYSNKIIYPQTTKIPVFGYWTSDVGVDGDFSAWYIDYRGSLCDWDPYIYDDMLGVRPVITLQI